MSRSASRSCSNCARPDGNLRVRVRPVRKGVPRVGSLELCPRCREAPEAAWRLRWSPLG